MAIRDLVAVNDLGPSGKTWTLALLTFAGGRIDARTMTEGVCIDVIYIEATLQKLDQRLRYK